MKFGIVGNNDGPLFLLKALQGSDLQPEFVGLQKPVSGKLKDSYQQELGDKVTFFQGFDEPTLIKKLNSYSLDLLINCFCNFRFDALLHQPFTVLNVHLSPLPKYRGRHPVQWALINGEEEFGVSIHKMTEEYDAGDIYWQKMVPVDEGMSVETLRNRLMETLQSHFHHFLAALSENRIVPRTNNDQQSSYMPRRYPQDSKLSEWHNGKMIFRKVQALGSEVYPAYIITDDQKIVCTQARLGEKVNQPVDQPYINQISETEFQVVCCDQQTVWLQCQESDMAYLHPGMEIEPQ